MNRRPAIPIEVQRLVLMEARHQCAVCCAPTALEKAHIEPWSKTQDHSPSNLIALCATCHTRSHTENWDSVILRGYKKDPCALKRDQNRLPPMRPVKKALVDLILDSSPEER